MRIKQEQSANTNLTLNPGRLYDYYIQLVYVTCL